MDFMVAKVKTLASRTALSDEAALAQYEAYLNGFLP